MSSTLNNQNAPPVSEGNGVPSHDENRAGSRARPVNGPTEPTEPFKPRRFLHNGHLQTLAGNFLPRKNGLPAPEDRLIEVEPGIRVLCHCHWQPQRQTRATVVIVHGLEGSSDSQYVIGNGSKAWAVGMNVVRMNMRTCGGTDHLAHTLYHSGLSNDVAAVIRHLIEQEKLPRIGAIGYSMGGNLVLKMACSKTCCTICAIPAPA